MQPEGRVVLGLDEFMLRLGHLKILLTILAGTSGNRARITRRLAEELTRPVQVTKADAAHVADYLLKKGLCSVLDVSGNARHPRSGARYSQLAVQLDANNHPVEIKSPSSAPEIWFQDWAISDPRTASKVGAVTVDTREITNKSGVSHLVDWAVVIGAANSRLGLTALGRTAARLTTLLRGDENPYVLGAERLAFAALLFTADGDVLLPLIIRTAGLRELTKATAVETMLATASDLAAGRSDERSSNRATRAIQDLRKDLGETSSRRNRAASRRPSSSVWHRVSSRLEALTDLGLMTKTDPSGKDRQYEYYYRATPALTAIAASAKSAASASDWTQKHLAQAFAPEGATIGDEGCEAEFHAAATLVQGPTGIHIDSLAVAASTLALAQGKHLPLDQVRRRLTNLAGAKPGTIALSRGYSGSRAEFASITPKAMALGPDFFALH